MQDNSEQREAWNGPVGTSWNLYHDALDEMMQPITAKLLTTAALKPGERVLDVGCGTGPTSIAAAQAVAPTGRVTGVDISSLLLANARERAAKFRLPLNFVEADAATYSFADKYDKILSRFGVMFFAEPVSALSNLKSCLAAKGEMIFICWRRFDENPWIFDLMKEATKIVPLPPRPKDYAPGPFAFGELRFLDGILSRAGFAERHIEGFEPLLRIPGNTKDERLAYYGKVGPFASLIREASADDQAKLRALLTDWIAARGNGGPMIMGAACWLVHAR